MSSAARIAANRANSLKSSGPRTPEGRERSRRNGLKHGLTGQGVVVPEEDVDEVERRVEALEADLDPQSALGAILVRQMATLSVRMERGARQESASLATRVRHAAEEFDRERVEEAEWLLEAIADDPRGHLRDLRRMPEGVDLLVRAWQALRADLTRDVGPGWFVSHYERAANLAGLRVEEARGSRLEVLSKAAWADFRGLADHEGAGLDDPARRAWARARLVERVDAEVADLEAHRRTLDLGMIALDRAEAGDRALFDPSREATLARRYESESRRGFFKALKEFRQAEAEAETQVQADVEAEGRAEATSAPGRSPAVAGKGGRPLASCRDGASPTPGDPLPKAEQASWTRDRAVRTADGRPLTVGRPVPIPG